MAAQTPTPEAAELHPPLEPPDADIAHCLGILQPILQMTIQELDTRGKPGWAGFLDTVYGVINDVFTAPADVSTESEQGERTDAGASQ